MHNVVKVLVVDDSPTARALIIGVLASDPELVVVGEARNGVEAVDLARRLRPDVITMDFRRPQMDGFEATKRIMEEVPTPIVVVSGSFDASDVEMSMHVLRVGALSVLSKPDGPGSNQFETSQTVFVRTVKTLAGVKVVRRRPPGPSAPSAPPPGPVRRRAKIVGIGGSTGGPGALRMLLEQLPADFGAPVLVVQHISPGFIAGMVQWLDAVCKLRVKVATHSEPLRSGTIYVSPEQRHLRVLDGRVQVDAGPPIGGFRPAATAVFESLARAYGGSAVAVILTGMGRDGVEGLQRIRDQNGYVIAQDEASSVVFGMPRAAIEAGVVDEVLPIHQIAPRLDQLTRQEVAS